MQWGILIPPSKVSQSDMESKWSRALESVRKDVECFFGILKGRFRILKLGILFHDISDIDNMFFTCCTLHNMLHTFDGMENLEPAAEWGGKGGLHDPWDNPPVLDEGTVGSTGADDGATAPEDAHFVLKKQLITHFDHRRRNHTLQWLQHSVTSQ